MSIQNTPDPTPIERSLHWFRSDLRLADNAALLAAIKAGSTALIYIDETNADFRPLGGARRWWLHGALAELRDSIRALGGTLTILKGDSRLLVPALAQALNVGRVTWNRRYGLPQRECDGEIKADLKSMGIEALSYNGALLYEPWEVKTQAGGVMRVFTPFWRAAQALRCPDAPLPPPQRLPPSPEVRAAMKRESLTLEDLELLPTKPDWAGGLREHWQPGEAGAQKRLARFVTQGLSGYAALRDRPDGAHTSCLSPFLACGNISPRQIWHGLPSQALANDVAKFRAELGWREFSYHLLYHFPDFSTRNHQARFDAFPWREDADALTAWQRGQTGYPLVDAGMRELYRSGIMHNRVRMIAASFLTKHLLLDWRAGERWFFDTLVDADEASNAASWQWVAGSGADAAPYFRIFNPVLQGEKFDPNGDYVRRHVPELAQMPARYIHKPWAAPPQVLSHAQVELGQTYPAPIVDHAQARARAMNAFAQINGG